MLGKLLKYEFVATSRFFIITYPAIIVLALLNRIFISSGINSSELVGNSYWFSIFTALSMTLYVGITCAVLVGTTILMMQRFYKNMFGDEGYLMHTLPVEPWQHILSKVLVSAVWMFASFVMTVLSVLILSYGMIPREVMAEFMVEFNAAFSLIGLSTATFWSKIAISMFFSLFVYMLPLYAAITIGQFWRKHRIFGAVLAYIGISTVSQMLSGVVMQIHGMFWRQSDIDVEKYFYFGVNDEFALNFSVEKYFNSIMLSSLLLSLLLSVGLFFLTNYLLKRKLDLE